MRSYLNFSFDIFDGIGWFHFEGNGLSGESFNKDLHGGNFAGLKVNVDDHKLSC